MDSSISEKIDRYTDEYEANLVEEYISSAKIKLIIIGVFLAVGILLALYSLGLGLRDMDFFSTIGMLVDHLNGKTYALHSSTWFNDNILWNSNVPRLVFTIFAGVGLAVAGTAMQSTMNNPLAGQTKTVQNYISATPADGRTYALFTPLAPYETPEAMLELCEAYNFAVGEGKVDPLLIIPRFIHDFLCIHPFIDGNGRMSRLLTTLLLYRCGYEIGKYISLEAKIARTKESYYDTLEASQTGWHEGKDDPTAFIKYLLGTIIAAYRDFEERMELVSTSPLDTVRNAVKTRIGKFTKAEIAELVTSMSATSVERHLRTLCASGEIEKRGGGRSTYYIRKTI